MANWRFPLRWIAQTPWWYLKAPQPKGDLVSIFFCKAVGSIFKQTTSEHTTKETLPYSHLTLPQCVPCLEYMFSWSWLKVSSIFYICKLHFYWIPQRAQGSSFHFLLKTTLRMRDWSNITQWTLWVHEELNLGPLDPWRTCTNWFSITC